MNVSPQSWRPTRAASVSRHTVAQRFGSVSAVKLAPDREIVNAFTSWPVGAPMSRRKAGEDAEVIVVGAGPAGSTAATYLARAGLDVLLLEKSTFPREKVCGDGLTPRGIKQLIDLGIDTGTEAGWLHNRGLRILTKHHRPQPGRAGLAP